MTRSFGSFAHLLLAVLTVVNAVQIQHGYVSPINRQTSGMHIIQVLVSYLRRTNVLFVFVQHTRCRSKQI